MSDHNRPIGALKKILFIRRDNIGDLVCTTPSIRAVRVRFPGARIAVLVNTYNAEMLKGNPDIDDLFIYEKAKHSEGRGKLGVWLSNSKLMRRIRKEEFDVAIACGSYSVRLARYTYLTGARERIGYTNSDAPGRYYNRAIPEPTKSLHEVERVFRLLEPLGIKPDPETGPGPMVLTADPEEIKKFAVFKKTRIREVDRPLLAVAISTRIKVNKWSEEKFIELIEQVLYKNLANVLLLWAPGSATNPFFPGGEESAARIERRFEGRILAYPTSTLPALVAAMATSDVAVNLDGGSLHIAAALGVPTVALIRNKTAPQWHPWGVQSKVLKADVIDTIPVEAVFEAVSELIAECKGVSV